MTIFITLPEGSKCLLKEGQKVDLATPFIENEVSCEVKIPIAKKLEIDHDKIFRYLKKLVGEKIKKGDIIAIKKGFFGTTKVVSEYNGLIKEINHHSGELIVNTTNNDKKTIYCYFKGKIKNISENKIQLEVEKAEDFLLKTTTGNFGGAAYYYQEKTDLKSEDINSKIVIFESISSFYQTKIEALGNIGFVSLIKLPEETTLNNCLIKNIDDIKKIFKHNLPYCLIDNKTNKLYFYK